jgi:signal transduction histidine kinase
MERLVQALLDASRLAEGRVQLQRGPADLSALLRGAVADWQRHGHTCTFAVSVPGEPVEAHVDSSRVRQVLDALLYSAVRETAPGSTLHVGLTASPLLATFTVGQGARPGLSLEEGCEVAGTEQGLGLFVASELARLHGGSVAVRGGPRAAYSVKLPRLA